MRRKGISRRAARKRNRKRPKSSIEKLVAAWLVADGIPFRTEVKCGKCHIDIVLGNKIAIELNGCYWHGCHICFPNMSKKMQMKRFKDIHRYQFLRKRGYKVYVIWECKILNKPDEAREELRGYGNIPIL